MKKEELSDFIIKNLVLFILFCIFCITLTKYLLEPKFQNFQEEKNQLKHAQILQIRTQRQNQQIQDQIQELKIANQVNLTSLQKKVTLAKIQTIAQDFFTPPVKIKNQKTSQRNAFSEVFFKIEAQSNGVKPIFDFIEALSKNIPNSTIVLPVDMSKKDPQSSTLDFSFFIRVTQLKNAQ